MVASWLSHNRTQPGRGSLPPLTTKPPWVDGLRPTLVFWWIVKGKQKEQGKLRWGEAKKQETGKGALQG